MPTATPELGSGDPADRSTLGAFAAGEALLLTGLAIAGVALLASVRFCADAFLGCSGDSSSPSGAGVAFVVLGGAVAAVGPPMIAARRSQRADWTRAAALAVAACLLSLVVGVLVFETLVRSVIPAIGLALGVQGALAVRSPSPSATRARALVGGTFVLLEALVPAGGLVLVLITYPALGFADSHASSLDRL